MRRWRGGAAVGVFTLADTKVGLGVKKMQGAVVALGHFHTTKIRTSCRISYIVAIFLILRGKVRVCFSRYCRKKSNRRLVKPNRSPTFANVKFAHYLKAYFRDSTSQEGRDLIIYCDIDHALLCQEHLRIVG